MKQDIGERMARMEEKVENTCASVARIEEKLDSFFERGDKKYASKLTEKIVYGMVGAVALSVLYYALAALGIK